MKTKYIKDKRTFGLMTSLIASILLLVANHGANAMSDIQAKSKQGSPHKI